MALVVSTRSRDLNDLLSHDPYLLFIHTCINIVFVVVYIMLCVHNSFTVIDYMYICLCIAALYVF